MISAFLGLSSWCLVNFNKANKQTNKDCLRSVSVIQQCHKRPRLFPLPLIVFHPHAFPSGHAVVALASTVVLVWAWMLRACLFLSLSPFLVLSFVFRPWAWVYLQHFSFLHTLCLVLQWTLCFQNWSTTGPLLLTVSFPGLGPLATEAGGSSSRGGIGGSQSILRSQS